MALVPGTRLGHYEVVAPLGRDVAVKLEGETRRERLIGKGAGGPFHWGSLTVRAGPSS